MDILKNIFATVLNLPLEQIKAELSPENCAAWDSLNAIVLVTEIENAFAIRFSFDEAMAVKNFGDAIQLISSKGVDLHA
jgi:acyl carrier protein